MPRTPSIRSNPSGAASATPPQHAGATWRRVRTAAKTPREAFRFILEYLALRSWGLLIGCFPIETNLRTARFFGGWWWKLVKRHRERALDNLRPSFPEKSDAELNQLARSAFEHFAQLYMVELSMTPRMINAWSWSRYTALTGVDEAVEAMLNPRGTILVTPHFGNYELLGFSLARLGLPVHAVMRPLDNPLVNEHLVNAREASGLHLLFKKGASERADEILESGGRLCFIADQDAGRKGVFADFFGRPASWYKSIALLAIKHEVPIVCGAAARVREGFHYEVNVSRVVQPREWLDARDRKQRITELYAKGLEELIRMHPEQYLWMHRRWKSQPRGAGDAAPRNA